jgi:hypothetical protein
MSTPYDAPPEQIYGTSSEKDRRFWARLEDILAEYPHSIQHLLGHWPVYTKRILLCRFLAHWEIFRQVSELPGSILELGVSRGVSLLTFHKFLEITHPADTGRRVFGIDSFEGLTDFGDKDGAQLEDAARADRQVGEIMALLDLFNADNVLARERVTIFKGRVADALPRLLEANPGLRFSLVHFDMDLYEPTKYALDALWDLIVPGGAVVFDEYAVRPWEGETRAVDEFFRERGLKATLKKFPWAPTPGGYFLKP